MSDETDLDDLARRYLDLWREQVSATASDPQTVETLSRAFAIFAQGGTQHSTSSENPANLFPWLTGMQQMAMSGASEGANDFDAAFRAFTGQEPPPGATPGAEAAAAQPDNRSQSISELECRVAALEERIAQLESKPRKSRKSTPRRAGKNKS